MRIATLLPSATEIVAALGAADDIVGVSHSCDFPPGVRQRPRVTSTTIPTDADSAAIDRAVREELAAGRSLYHLDVDRLRALAPDVIVSQRLCDVCAVSSGHVVAALAKLPGRPLLIDLSPVALNDILADITAVGRAIGRGDAAAELTASLSRRIDDVAGRTRQIDAELCPSVGFLEWLDPPFSGGHWNPELVALAGGRDAFGETGEPSRTLSWDEIAAADPHVLYVAVCGYDAERARADVARLARTEPWASLSAVRAGRVYVANGDAFFARPGPRVVDGLEQLAHVLHPHVHEAPAAA
ncbi:MAG: cobalamin-binding protein [Pseudomonadota bacterium]